jgi:hypothetical protein
VDLPARLNMSTTVGAEDTILKEGVFVRTRDMASDLVLDADPRVR